MTLRTPSVNSITDRPVDALTDYSRSIYLGHYARTLDTGNREHYAETTARMIEHLFTGNDHVRRVDTPELRARIRAAVLDTNVMPSMRAFQTAGAAAARDNTTMYNCSYTTVEHVCRFGEIMYILMCGSGVGFSCETHIVAQLPVVADAAPPTDPPAVVQVADSKEGWKAACDAYVRLAWLEGRRVAVDYSLVRPAGAPLRTMGGVASGPEPLRSFFGHLQRALDGARGRRLRAAEVHALVCQIAEVVQMGGVRRSALISLFSADDEEMLRIKSGDWYRTAPWLASANNSAVFCAPHTKNRGAPLMRMWAELQASGSGEPGIFNRTAARDAAARSGRDLFYDRASCTHIQWGTNPCGEIVLRPQQFCNLTEVVVRASDTEDTIADKVELATIIGAMQSTFTHFPALSAEWERNCRAERLLGVSLTGVYDNALFSTVGPELDRMLERLRARARAVATDWAARLGVNPSAAVTCVKPSGTVSQVVDSASGLHPRWSAHYVRSTRCAKIDPLYQFLRDAGVPHEDDEMNASRVVFYWPIKAPAGVPTRDQLSALDHLRLWLTYTRHWCDHNASCTVNIRPREWGAVAEWVYTHFDNVLGLSFMPYDGGDYAQPPYRACSAAEYEERRASQPRLDWAKLARYERGTHYTTQEREPACTAGGCEIRPRRVLELAEEAAVDIRRAMAVRESAAVAGTDSVISVQ